MQTLFHNAIDNIHAGGWLMPALGLVTFAIWALYFRALFRLHGNTIPPDAIKPDLLLLSALVASAPLLGLLGTVLGMIDTFQAVASQAEDTGALVSKGIAKALITTQYGLTAAIPGAFAILHVKLLLKKKLNS